MMKPVLIASLLPVFYARRVNHVRTHDLGRSSDEQPQYPTIPSGVNFGGWLCLEDWFHSGDAGRYVSTPLDQFPEGQGACLPPSAAKLDRRWASEGSLVKSLMDKHGAERTAEIFMAHRRHFIGNDDLEAVRSLGIKTIRVPITWAAFPDALIPIDAAIYGSFDPNTEVKVVPDPFYHESHFMVTIPRDWLKAFLRKCAAHGLKVNLDIHAYPGGSSDGTFNGIWPETPRFWKETSRIGNTALHLRDVGIQVAHALIAWVENLPDLERSAVGGISPMNEPGHLSWGGAEWGSYSDVLPWYAEVAGHFKTSRLPSLGIKMYVQLIATAFPDWGHDFIPIVKQWFDGVFTPTEQQQWAVMDHHWYSAWSGQECSGRTSNGGAYHCDQSPDEIRQILETSEGCMKPWAEKFHENFPYLKAISEFSIGTFHEAMHACTDKTSQNVFLDSQVKMWNRHGIEPFFWTWRMPYGPVFEPGWSLKYITGLEDNRFHMPCDRPFHDNITANNAGSGDGTHQTG